MNYNEMLNENYTIACSNNGDENFRVRGCGHYDQKAYAPVIKVVCEVNGVMLRTVKSVDTKIEIWMDGDLINRYSSLKIAEQFFMDFAGISKAKFKKLAHV